MKSSKPALKNRILLLIGAVLAIVLSLVSIRGAFDTAVALEQTARCGAVEHHHSAACYENDRLCCGMTEHTHNRNCYLVLLSSNDINSLLSEIGEDQNHSLEALISRTLETNALNADISAMNLSLSTSADSPNLVLNENLYDAAAQAGAFRDPTDILPDVAGNFGSVVPLDVGDAPNNDSYNANFYVSVDREDNWVCIGTMTFDVTTRTSWWGMTMYVASLNTSSIINFINDAMDSNLKSNNISLRYAESANPNQWKQTGTSGSNTTFGSDNTREATAKAAKDVRVLQRNGSSLLFYTVTYEYADGTTDTVYVQSGNKATLPAGHTWLSGGNTYTGGQSVSISSATTFTEKSDTPITYTVTYQYPDKPSETETVQAGQQVTLPAGYTWTANGNSYNGGTGVTITANTTFVGTLIPTTDTLYVRYSVNFPMSGYSYSGLTVTKPAASPTIEGMAGTAGIVTVESGGRITVPTVSQTMVNLETSHSKDFDYPVLFRGWETETGELISAHSRVGWDELRAYDQNGDGTVTLNGVWEHGVASTANFFILFNSAVDQTSGLAKDYTDVIYTTFMGNSNTARSPLYTASNDTVALANDAKIRAMYGERADEMWFNTFPSDDEIFEALKSYATSGTLTVGGETVRAEDLNSNEYAIRWYHVAYDSGDGWHIDGKLTRKVGVVEVSKTFSGNETLIAAAKQSFSITATNGTRSVILNSTNTVDDGDGDPNTWFWRVEDVEYNELWTLTESASVGGDVIHYAEWSVSDASANSQTANGTGGSTTVRGVTYANDIANPEWLQVDFNNIYYHRDSLMIKKADGVTGEALSGAQFQLYQNSELMSFTYNAATGLYEYDSTGSNPNAITELSGDGYINISTTGFSYDLGPITVVEVKAPLNYNPVGSILVGYTGATVGGLPEVGILNNTDSFATYHDGLLVVKNSTNTLNVTAEKEWQCDETEWRDITIQLFANGSSNLASTLTGTASTVVTLNAANNYTFTWTDLPIYAYGARVEWSIRETRIGDEACKADYTFANWAVSYDAPVYDSGGNVTLVVHNTPSRPMLYLTKTSVDGSMQLAGATFSLTQVRADGTPVPGFVTRTATTAENGLLIFDNLLYGARYRITEDLPPPGHKPIDTPIYLTIAEGGVVTVEAHPNARADSVAYNVVVTNISYPPMPETGGSGPGVYYGLGGALMLLAACGYILLNAKKGRRCQAEP